MEIPILGSGTDCLKGSLVHTFEIYGYVYTNVSFSQVITDHPWPF